MKGFRLLFAVLLAPLVFRHAVADDASEIARAATRRDMTAPTQTTRQKTISSESKLQNTTPTASYSRTLDVTPLQTLRERSTTQQNVAQRATTTTTPTKNIVKRTNATNVAPRDTSATVRGTARTATTPRSTPIARTGTQRSKSPNYARTATISRAALTAPEIISRDYTKCRETFYGCMDEFCANKDTQLKRCACSSRVNEFGKTQKMLDAAEDKLLDFSQRLLVVNLDKEDAAAIHTATEGEIAYNTKDTSASKKMLDEIANKLNTSFNDNTFNQSLAPISLSLDIDSAFDNIDSMRGASTTAKSGPALHAAALPVCREMAAEVCSPDELAIAESGYKMLIEQDCNTVAKSYQAKTDLARERVFEGGALLDMSRLDIHQKRNSDDILTCKNKMLDMLTDSTVCGSDMGKCLDTSGRYIDPTTGTAFLTPELVQLNSLITRPTSGETWTTAATNQRFVAFLESKKKFLAPATENCQDISDYVWDSFIEDALSQIKLAQEKKLEEIRQSCTTLTAQCYSDTIKSITDLDGRALSIFGVSADKTAKAMCADVLTACTAVLAAPDGTSDENPWLDGATDIINDTTYATILTTCREVGRACIIQVCTSISGNFGLCENISTSINRKSIINRTACWDEVEQCVRNAGADNVLAILQSQSYRDQTYGDMYSRLYNLTDLTRHISSNDTAAIDDNGSNTDTTQPQTDPSVDDLCKGCMISDNATNPTECAVCRLTEQIWGNCEYEPSHNIKDKNATNRIWEMDKSDKNETLLSWFARNTGTSGIVDNCRDTSCGAGYQLDSKTGNCLDATLFTSGGLYCPTPKNKIFDVIGQKGDANHISNCCPINDNRDNSIDAFGNCCMDTTTATLAEYNFISRNDKKADLCLPQQTQQAQQATIVAANDQYTIVCLGKVVTPENPTKSDGYPNGDKIYCDGKYVVINNGNYSTNTNNDNIETPNQYYINNTDPDTQQTNIDAVTNWFVDFVDYE
ncbi:MAG: hypothetical protein IKL37_05005 [Alphaproteobacteria bacterium]|nr:hypothetical protein [Alphaproteobacteria bacterium]